MHVGNLINGLMKRFKSLIKRFGGRGELLQEIKTIRQLIEIDEQLTHLYSQ